MNSRLPIISICGSCLGSGTSFDNPCEACRGLGAAAQSNGRIFALAAQLSASGFLIRDNNQRLERLVTFLTLGVTILAGLGSSFLIVSGEAQPLTATFWFETSGASLLVLFFLLLVPYTYFRFRRESEDQIIIAKEKTLTEDSFQSIEPSEIVSQHYVELSKSFAPEVWQLLKNAFELARKFQDATIEPVHLFASGPTTRLGAYFFWRLGLSLEGLRDKLFEIFPKPVESARSPDWSPRSLAMIFSAYAAAAREGRPTLDSIDLMLAAVQADERLTSALFAVGVPEERYLAAADWIRLEERQRTWRQTFVQAAALKPIGPMNRAMTSIATPILDQVSEDLTAAAAFGALPMVVGRERELDEVVRVMESGTGSVILVGPSAVGRHAIVNGLAIRMVLEDVPAILADKRLVSLSIPRLIAGVHTSEAEATLLRALYEVGASGNIVLVVPELAAMAGSTAGGGLDLLETFAIELQKGYFLCVALATPEEYRAIIERRSIAKHLGKVPIEEMKPEAAIRVLEISAAGIEARNGVAFTIGALEAAARLTDRYLHDELLPGKAISALRIAALQTRKARGAGALVNEQDVAKIIAERSLIPLAQVATSESEKLLHLEELIGKRMIGQLPAVTAVAAALRRARAELRSGKRPIGSFLFLGPTGVGKTELSKAVASVYFGSEKQMLRFDMSEYQDIGSIERILGSASGSGGVLTEAVRKNPFSLLLFDELEKAHPDILNLFLQVMDDGRLTDVSGRTVDFTNTIIIMTSNAGSSYIQDENKKGTVLADIRKGLLERELRSVYRPEFLNRFDEVIVFSPLTLPEVTRITELLILDVANRLEAKGYRFRAEEAAIADLAKRGYDPMFGARPLRRLIQDTLENTLADLILRSQVTKGDTIILNEGGEVKIEKGSK